MIRSLLTLCLVLIWVGASALLRAQPLDPNPMLTVGIRTQAKRVEISSTQGFSLTDQLHDRTVVIQRSTETLVLEAGSEGIRVQGVGTFAVLGAEPLPGSLLKVDGQRYRGRLRIEEDRFGRLTAINQILLEDYLRGVIPAEMITSSPVEALKAQAVVARTFALLHKDRFLKDRGYGLSADTESQVYLGLEGEDPRTTQAVVETSGSVIHSGGGLLESYYHQACGGRTQNNEDVWGGRPLAHLRAVDCSWCAALAQATRQKGFEWRRTVRRRDLQARLLAVGYSVGEILEVEQEVEECGRARRFEISHAEGQLSLPPSRIRQILGEDKVMSSFYRLGGSETTQAEPVPAATLDPFAETQLRSIISGYLHSGRDTESVSFEGRGFGHGVGLCQWGARFLAGSAKKSHSEILRYYYQGASVGSASVVYSGD